jgi:FAD dependent oxidoreductase TIGR03364
MAGMEVAIVGAGIVGLAHAWSAAKRGHRVTVYERGTRAAGASIRNFGMVWPIGQPPGPLYRIAMATREQWKILGEQAGMWLNECGSMHLARRPDEMAVLEDFTSRAKAEGYDARLLTPGEVRAKTPAAKRSGLLGGMFSATEVAVNPRQALAAIPNWLTQKFDIRFHFNTPVSAVSPAGGKDQLRPTVQIADGSSRSFNRVIVCGGSDVPLLFPKEYASSGLIACKLQMMRTVAQPNRWDMGPHLASGLTLRHYRAFENCPSLPALKNRIAQEMPLYDRFGIHVMASQNEVGEVTLGDSHEYGDAIEPFDKSEIDELILRELHELIELPDWTIAERWHGVYVKHPTKPIVEIEASPNVHLCVGTGGCGMTLAFGLAEEAWNRWPN